MILTKPALVPPGSSRVCRSRVIVSPGPLLSLPVSKTFGQLHPRAVAQKTSAQKNRQHEHESEKLRIEGPGFRAACRFTYRSPFLFATSRIRVRAGDSLALVFWATARGWQLPNVSDTEGSRAGRATRLLLNRNTLLLPGGTSAGFVRNHRRNFCCWDSQSGFFSATMSCC